MGSVGFTDWVWPILDSLSQDILVLCPFTFGHYFGLICPLISYNTLSKSCSSLLNETVYAASPICMFMSVSSYLRRVIRSYPRLQESLKELCVLDLLHVSSFWLWLTSDRAGWEIRALLVIVAVRSLDSQQVKGLRLKELMRGPESKQASERVIFLSCWHSGSRRLDYRL